jgi:hypothetical protein
VKLVLLYQPPSKKTKAQPIRVPQKSRAQKKPRQFGPWQEPGRKLIGAIVLARFMTAGHELCTPNNLLVAPIAGSEQKIIFRNHISGKQRNSRLKRFNMRVFGRSVGRYPRERPAVMSFRAADELQLSDRIGENAQ